jgi:hypothetical protein
MLIKAADQGLIQGLLPEIYDTGAICNFAIIKSRFRWNTIPRMGFAGIAIL